MRFEDRAPRYEARKPPPIGGDIRSGGARPEIAPETPPTVDFAYDFPANSIVIVTGSRKLYYVLPDQKAYEYRVSVGREGFNWNGTEKAGSESRRGLTGTRQPKCASETRACPRK